MLRLRLRAIRSSMPARPAVGLALAGAVVVGALAVAGASAGVTAGNAFPNGSSWKYLTNPEGEPTDWQMPGFDDSTWSAANAPFGDDDGTTCSGILPAPPWNDTVFPQGGTVLLRQTFSLPSNAYGLRLLGTVDNDASVYVNGTLANSPDPIESGSCELDAIDLSIANTGLNLGDDNLVAVRAVDNGVISFFDMQATHGVVEFGTQPSETLEKSTIDPAPTVTITDAEGNPVAGETVSVALDVVNGSGTFTGGSTTSETTDSSGVATFDDLAVTLPGQYTLTASASGATVTSDTFAVDDLLFGQQPTETQKGVAISPAPTLTIKDPYGVGIPNKTVDVTLQTINGTGTLSGTLSATTDSGGVATLSNLKISDVGKYKLVATSDNTSATSGGFLVANQVNPCSGSCKASGSVQNNTSVDASATNATGKLAVSVFGGTAPPGGVCTGFTPQGTGSFVNILPSGATLPDFVITWTLDKSLVKKAGNPGASKYNICLGAEDLQHPNGTGATPWKTKSGANAVGVADADLGVTLFWGILPDCPNKGRASGPCVLHRNKTNAGDVVVTIFKPAPWDASMHGG